MGTPTRVNKHPGSFILEDLKDSGNKISFWPSAKNKWVLNQILIDSDSGHIKLIIGMGLDVWFRYLWRIWKRNFWLYLKGSLRCAGAARAAP